VGDGRWWQEEVVGGRWEARSWKVVGGRWEARRQEVGGGEAGGGTLEVGGRRGLTEEQREERCC
jgi:hypothetical protein